MKINWDTLLKSTKLLNYSNSKNNPIYRIILIPIPNKSLAFEQRNILFVHISYNIERDKKGNYFIYKLLYMISKPNNLTKKKSKYQLKGYKSIKKKTNKICTRPIQGVPQNSDEQNKQLNERRDIPWSWIERLPIVKMLLLPKLIYKFNVIPIKIPASYFVNISKVILKFIWKGNVSKIAKDSLHWIHLQQQCGIHSRTQVPLWELWDLQRRLWNLGGVQDEEELFNKDRPAPRHWLNCALGYRVGTSSIPEDSATAPFSFAYDTSTKY